ncbi:required for drug-induced death protein 1 [Rhinoderma darwinii]|uniref:required for drug-induced death protein 1 n=1 Tax=Rhinoderma darwinii TaxID=43563 RepID=UPI003F67C0C4
MAGRFKIRGKKKNKYRKMRPDKLQGEKEHGEGSRNQQELQEPAEQCKTSQGKKKKKEKKGRSSKKVHLSPLPDRYEPLEENVEETESKEDKKYKKKQKVKKYAKNVGKAVRTGCRYLVIGLQGLANAYVAPFGVTSVVLSATSR